MLITKFDKFFLDKETFAFADGLDELTGNIFDIFVVGTVFFAFFLGDGNKKGVVGKLMPLGENQGRNRSNAVCAS